MSYRRKSYRLRGYDYTQSGIYYITICTNNHDMFFGNIKNGKIILSNIGKIAQKFWAEIPRHFNQIYIDIFIIMPNHIHGILIINNNPTMFYRGTACRAPINNRSPIEYGAFRHEKFGVPCKGSIPTVIRSYKSAVTCWCHKNEYNYFGWQRNFYMSFPKNKDFVQV